MKIKNNKLKIKKECDFKKTIYNTIKNVQCQRINQTEIIQDHYIENYKTLSREIKKK